jgi:hypothetical protein
MWSCQRQSSETDLSRIYCTRLQSTFHLSIEYDEDAFYCCSADFEATMRASLFITCYNDTLFPETGQAVVRLLERLGFDDQDFPTMARSVRLSGELDGFGITVQEGILRAVVPIASDVIRHWQ